MAFTLTYPTTGPLPGPTEIADWLTEQGEPFEEEGPTTLALRALPLRLVFAESGQIKGQVDVGPRTPLTRLVRIIFDLSVRLGADVRLAGVGAVRRADLWLRFADEEDRLCIADALEIAESHSQRDEIFHGFWSMLCALGHGQDIRWDAAKATICEMKEVGAEGGLSVDEAQWFADEPQPGDSIPVPVRGTMHIEAWRWLAEAYPSLLRT